MGTDSNVGGADSAPGQVTANIISDCKSESVEQPDTDSGSGFVGMQLAALPANALMDERALAACLGISTRTLRRLVSRRQLIPGMKMGARRMWMAGKVVEYLEAQADRVAAAARRLTVYPVKAES